jgi:hypothetical protein
MHWHRLFVDASLFIATGSLGVLALFASIQEPTVVQTGTVSSILLIMAGLGWAANRYIYRQICVIRGIIQRIDQRNGAFEGDFDGPGTASLYPASWQVTSSEDWHDPILRAAQFWMAALPVFLALGALAIGLR